MMTTRTRSRRTQVKVPLDDEVEQSTVKSPRKGATKEIKSKKQLMKKPFISEQRSETTPKASVSKKTSDGAGVKAALSKKGKRTKKDTHSFSSYFESKRGTVQYSYHVSPAAQVFIASPSPAQQSLGENKDGSKKMQRKRKADATVVFDYCSEDEEVVLPVQAKKSNVAGESKKNSTARKRNAVSPNQKAAKKPKPEKSTNKVRAPVSSMKTKTTPKTTNSLKKGNSEQKQVSRTVSSSKKVYVKKAVTKPLKKEAPKAPVARKRKRTTARARNAGKKSNEAEEQEKGQLMEESLVSTEYESNIETSTGCIVETALQSTGDLPEETKANEEPADEEVKEVQVEEQTHLEKETKSVTEEENHQETTGNDNKELEEVKAMSVEDRSEDKDVIEPVQVQRPVEADTQLDTSGSLAIVENNFRQSLEPSADLSLTETEKTYVRRSFDHHLTDIAPTSVPSRTRLSSWPKASVSATSSIPNQPTKNEPRMMVRNVRQAHECLQHGENVQFRDQAEYLIDNMRPSQPLSVRCLSTLSLATECLKLDFCRQLRAHGLVYKIMILLKDAVEYPSLRVAAVTFFYVVSCDRIDGSDLDRTCLELLLGLMGKPQDEEENSCSLDEKGMRELKKIEAKSQSVLEKCQPLAVREKDRMAKEHSEDILDNTNPNNAEGLQPSSLSVPGLVCEVFYNITSTQSSCHWIKEEMRILGILDVIANTAIDLTEKIEESLPREIILKMIRAMKLLENTTFLNKGNQTYLTVFDGSLLVSRLCSCLVNLKSKIVADCESRYLCLEGLLGILRVLLNLTHDHELGSFRVGEQSNVLECVLECIFKIPENSAGDRTFDLLILSLGLLINLVEHSAPNRQTLFDSHVSVTWNEENSQILASQAITELFMLNFKKSEENTIDVPTPQSLSQRTPTSSPLKTSFSTSVLKKDTSVPLASRLKIHKDIKGYRSPAKLRGPEGASTEEGDGMGWLPTDTDEDSNDEEEEEPVTDSLVFSREDFDIALTQAGKHMEDSIVSSYAALLLAVLAKHSMEFAESLKRQLPNSNYSSLISVLKEFIEFMGMAGSSTTRSGLDSIRKIVKHLETLEESSVVK